VHLRLTNTEFALLFLIEKSCYSHVDKAMSALGTNYMTGEKWVFEPRHVDEFLHFESKIINHKSDYLVLLQTGDDVLDYRDAQNYYSDAKIIIEQGGDHSFIDYDQHLAMIHQFLTAN